MHARHARTVESQTQRIPGVLEAAVSPVGSIHIEFDRQLTSEAVVREELQKIGVAVDEVSPSTPEKRADPEIRARRERPRA